MISVSEAIELDLCAGPVSEGSWMKKADRSIVALWSLSGNTTRGGQAEE